MMQLTDKLIESLLTLSEEAGRAILGVYDGPIKVTVKADDSPLTQADQAAHRLIEQALAQLTPQWPLVSEESSPEQQQLRTMTPCYWLVDPLDGTKEFIQRNGEFTVNLALIREGAPIFGVVHVPVQGLTYWGGASLGAWRRSDRGIQAIRGRAPIADEPLQVVGSRSHSNQQTQAYLATLGEYELISVGSSLKFCLLAEGRAHLYPRLAPTCEWDTAAAQAILEGAGGRVETLEGTPLRYSKAEILNPSFVARSW